ncbi:MAG TPA: NAD-dependent epimerase/dehydratase family protein [Polyangiaceae bacterium]
MSDVHTSSHSLVHGERVPLERVAPRRSVVAITGASTLLGTHLIGVLEEEPSVRRIVCLDSSRPRSTGAKARAYDIDLTRSVAEERLAETFSAEAVDVVVHLAFLDSPNHAADYAHELESVGTMQLLNACRRTQVHKVVMWSQTFLYGAHPTNPNYLSEKHPLRARRSEPFFANKIDAESEIARFGLPGRGRIATILRGAPLLGPNADNLLTRYLSRRFIPTVLGFDPLWQFLHEADAVAALRLAVLRDAPGIFNIVGDGVLPLRTAIRLAGRSSLPLPRSFASGITAALWLAQLADAPAGFFDYLQYICVADGALAHKILGFRPAYTSREALVDYANAQHLRDEKLLSERPA